MRTGGRAIRCQAMPVLLRHAIRRPTIAIDLGTAFVRVGTPSQPLAVERTIRRRNGWPAAMVGGVVNDIDAAAAVLADALSEARLTRSRRAHVLVSVPATATSVERAGVHWALRGAGVTSEAVLIEEPLAAAVGLGLDIAAATPLLIVDVGHGISEAAVIAHGAIQAIAGTRVGCAQLAEEALTERALALICRTVLRAIADVPADAAAAIGRLHLVGGGSMIPDVAVRLSTATGLTVHLAPDRFHAVAMGDAACAVETFRQRDAHRRHRTSRG